MTFIINIIILNINLEASEARPYGIKKSLYGVFRTAYGYELIVE